MKCCAAAAAAGLISIAAPAIAPPAVAQAPRAGQPAAGPPASVRLTDALSAPMALRTGTVLIAKPKLGAGTAILTAPNGRTRRVSLSKPVRLKLTPGTYYLAPGAPVRGRVLKFSSPSFTILGGDTIRIAARSVQNVGVITVRFDSVPAGGSPSVVLQGGGRSYELTPSKARLKLPAGNYQIAVAPIALPDGTAALGTPNVTSADVAPEGTTSMAVNYSSTTIVPAAVVATPGKVVGDPEDPTEVTVRLEGARQGNAVILPPSDALPYGFYGLITATSDSGATVSQAKPLDVFDNIDLEINLAPTDLVRAIGREVQKRARPAGSGKKTSSYASCKWDSGVTMSNNIGYALGSQVLKTNRDKTSLERAEVTIVLTDEMSLAISAGLRKCAIELPPIVQIPIPYNLWLFLEGSVFASVEIVADGTSRGLRDWSPRASAAIGAGYRDGEWGTIFKPSMSLGGLEASPFAVDGVWITAKFGADIGLGISFGKPDGPASLALLLGGEVALVLDNDDALAEPCAWTANLEPKANLTLRLNVLGGWFKAETELYSLDDFADRPFELRILDAVKC